MFISRPPWGQRLAAGIPGTRLVLVEDAGAFLPADQPERLARLIAEAASPASHRAA
jgi:pimeloyl-ACP methyl ester carboxylesterase